MAATVHSVVWKTVRKTWQTLGAIKTGVILLILVVIISAAGTVILQRPATDAEEMQRAYSPQVLHLLDGLGLTDVFHAWWFVALLVLVSLSIVAASVQRFPNSWRYYARPYKSPDDPAGRPDAGIGGYGVFRLQHGGPGRDAPKEAPSQAAAKAGREKGR